MNFYLTQVISGHGAFNTYTQVISGHRAFNAYLLCMKLAENPKCTNCDRRGRDNDAWHALFECPAFQLYWEDVMTILQEKGKQPLTSVSLVQLC